MMYIAVRFVLSASSESANAAAGLIAVLLTYLSYLGLRGLGRRHLPPPGLGPSIRDAAQRGLGESEYHI
jgi:hypothetical protein